MKGDKEYYKEKILEFLDNVEDERFLAKLYTLLRKYFETEED